MEREKERACEQHRKEHPVLASEPLISPLLPPKPPGGLADPTQGPPLPTLALHLSRNLVSPCRGALPTPCLVTPVPIPPPPLARGGTPLPTPTAASRRDVEGRGRGRFELSCSGQTLEAAGAALSQLGADPDGGAFQDLAAALGADGQEGGGLATTRPLCQPPAHLWWDPTAPDAAPQRSSPHHRSRDGRDIRECTWQDRGSTLNCPEQGVWAPDCRSGRDPLSAREAASPGLSTPVPDHGGAILASSHETLQPLPGQTPQTLGPHQPWYRGYQTLNLRLQQRPRRGGEGRVSLA